MPLGFLIPIIPLHFTQVPFSATICHPRFCVVIIIYMNEEITSNIPASSVGFSVEPPCALPDPDVMMQSLAPEEREVFLAELIKQNALYTAYQMQRQLAEEGLDPTTPRNHRLSILDQMVKLAKLDRKPVNDIPQGQQFSVVINIPGQPSVGTTIVSEPAALEHDG